MAAPKLTTAERRLLDSIPADGEVDLHALLTAAGRSLAEAVACLGHLAQLGQVVARQETRAGALVRLYRRKTADELREDSRAIVYDEMRGVHCRE